MLTNNSFISIYSIDYWINYFFHYPDEVFRRLSWWFILTTLIWVFLTHSSKYPCYGRGYCLKQSLSGIDLCHLQAYWSYSTVPNFHSDFLVQSHLLSCDVLSGVPLFSDTLHRSTLFVCFLQPLTGQYLDLKAPPHFHLQSPSRQTSINGVRWGDNEAPRHRLTEVREWQRHTEFSLPHNNERRTQERSEAASWTNPTEFGKLIPLCFE